MLRQPTYLCLRPLATRQCVWTLLAPPGRGPCAAAPRYRTLCVCRRPSPVVGRCHGRLHPLARFSDLSRGPIGPTLHPHQILNLRTQCPPLCIRYSGSTTSQRCVRPLSLTNLAAFAAGRGVMLRAFRSLNKTSRSLDSFRRLSACPAPDLSTPTPPTPYDPPDDGLHLPHTYCILAALARRSTTGHSPTSLLRPMSPYKTRPVHRPHRDTPSTLRTLVTTPRDLLGLPRTTAPRRLRRGETPALVAGRLLCVVQRHRPILTSLAGTSRYLHPRSGSPLPLFGPLGVVSPGYDTPGAL